MNCECIFIYTADLRDKTPLIELGNAMRDNVSTQIELDPVCISKIIAETAAYGTYDEAHGWASKRKKTILHPDDLILFACGKLHYMNKSDIKHYLPKASRDMMKNFSILFPATREVFFQDMEEI